MDDNLVGQLTSTQVRATRASSSKIYHEVTTEPEYRWAVSLTSLPSNPVKLISENYSILL